ncbi:DUF2061 domain-containing protein [Alteromonas aestuariivivens]|uniref:DUF2061 domain-containing protein n=1 Tax=Alteromonas aestuariivivens TaxID=1938339 RepID=A0A3D8MAY4_9ALTE|nr:DUF2061 domain-containing protein [Alteromonas aestuariivivens]RDV27450.1 DUF2061 domain-containing protein [Alteromonas aestuariivivens]
MKKTVSFAVMHFTVAFSVAYWLTGSVVVGGAVALVEPAINTVMFYFHEKVWQRVQSVRGQRRPEPRRMVSREGFTPFVH